MSINNEGKTKLTLEISASPEQIERAFAQLSRLKGKHLTLGEDVVFVHDVLMPDAKHNSWIRTVEQMPPQNRNVLVWNGKEDVTIGRWTIGHNGKVFWLAESDDDLNNYDFSGEIFWKPLPEL